ncbi:hypothetical protein MtrunA17_Chr2g0301291 [Medicago truncatula]|uniref:DUF7642 domain-containing protein n=1 Tax=Medicago truncatula TaxID=3880 RepID=A0A396JB62_MEDTR|nr:uncharacterized protein LOC25486541 [Medicago truncatula]RHN73695.1 hypothetical protein MtrunA17_Chr2g0301291 [Medicago truncatula]
MKTTMDEVVEIDTLEKNLLEENEGNEEEVLYAASFQEMEKNFIKYQTVQWILYSLLLILAWGIGLLMLLYVPVRRFILRKDIRSRSLYLTSNAIVYKVTRPVPFPCLGVLHKEKHVLLHSVADVVVEQGYLQSLFGVYSLRIENVGVRRPPSDNVKILGIANPNAFSRRYLIAVMMQLSNMRNEIVSRQVSTLEDGSHLMMSPSKSLRYDSTHSEDLLLLQKLEEVGSSVKRIQTLFEAQQSPTTETID